MDWRKIMNKIIDEHCANCDYAGPEYCNISLEDSACPYLWVLEALSSKVAIRYLYDNGNYLCPNCLKTINEEDGEYCPRCGQRVDWRK